MSRARNRRPTHPGQVLLNDVLVPLKTNISDAARKLGVSRKHLSLFINGHIPCSRDMATRLGKATDTSMESWLNMQTAIDVWESEHEGIDAEKYASIEKLTA
ncbi:addiction module antidote protein, HigA family [Amphritea atlantica]|uniref:Addiction module antidote protein, HigA family n=1 Tax=Amphritea atlantica TaxID=355243 RepID=A0A1H9L094_9GAMM|nr:HigA family addiction module antitoxin [Amphritea atlantica]SER04679.1 addiction module antidote protein, HigA family [Amphritea atlantica]